MDQSTHSGQRSPTLVALIAEFRKAAHSPDQTERAKCRSRLLAALEAVFIRPRLAQIGNSATSSEAPLLYIQAGICEKLKTLVTDCYFAPSNEDGAPRPWPGQKPVDEQIHSFIKQYIAIDARLDNIAHQKRLSRPLRTR